jgi:hypothetical protein
MLLIYHNSFKDNENLCKDLAALQFGSWIMSITTPQAAAYNTGPVVRQMAYYLTLTSQYLLALHDQPVASITSPTGNYLCFASKTSANNAYCEPVHTQDSIPNSIYCVLSGKQRDTWCIFTSQLFVINYAISCRAGAKDMS